MESEFTHATIEITRNGRGTTLRAAGDWVVRALEGAEKQLRNLRLPQGDAIELDLSGVQRADTTGAWLLERTRQIAESQGRVHVSGAPGALEQLMTQVGAAYEPAYSIPPRGLALVASIEGLGRGLSSAIMEAVNILGFTGQVVQTWLRWLVQWKRVRLTPIVYHMEQVGLNAVPIIALISFLIGSVLAFLGSDLLEDFGAEVYTVTLVSFAFLREFGVLLTAIMVAGRSGSAFTAQIGSMKNREEIDAMKALGLDHIELLVLPRVIAMVICLPMLTFLADIMGLLGGGAVLFLMEGMSPGQFYYRLQAVTQIEHFNVGIIKSVFFAAAIAIIGCYQGLKVEGSAESVGQRTTLSVVEAIFTVIVLDAVFAIYFIEIGY